MPGRLKSGDSVSWFPSEALSNALLFPTQRWFCFSQQCCLSGTELAPVSHSQACLRRFPPLAAFLSAQHSLGCTSLLWTPSALPALLHPMPSLPASLLLMHAYTGQSFAHTRDEVFIFTVQQQQQHNRQSHVSSALFPPYFSIKDFLDYVERTLIFCLVCMLLALLAGCHNPNPPALSLVMHLNLIHPLGSSLTPDGQSHWSFAKFLHFPFFISAANVFFLPI